MKEIRHPNLLLVLVSALLLSAAIAACGGVELAEAVDPAGDSLNTEGELQSEQPTSAPGEAVAEESNSEPLGSEALGLPPIVPGRAEMRATDPSTVVLAAGKPQLVEFIAYWCPICKAMAPTVHGLENLYGEQIIFTYLDRDDPATLPFQQQLGYVYQPHFFLLDANGAVLAQWRGFVEGVILQEALVAQLP